MVHDFRSEAPDVVMAETWTLPFSTRRRSTTNREWTSTQFTYTNREYRDDDN